MLSGRLAAVFVLVVILGGSNAVAVRLSNLELPPFWSAALRFGLAAAIFWAIAYLRRILVPRGRALYGIILFGVLTNGLFYAFAYWALVSVTASLTMVMLAVGPLLTFFLAWLHRQERFRWQGLAGALVALSGIGLAVGPAIGSSVSLLPLLALLAAVVVVAEGTVLFKSFPRSDPLMVNAVALTTGTAILLIISLLAGERWALPASPDTWLAFGYLVLGGSVLLFYLFLYLLQRWTASATSYAFLLFPVATIVIASWLTDEVISPRFLLGGAIVLVGVWLGVIARPKTAAGPAPVMLEAE